MEWACGKNSAGRLGSYGRWHLREEATVTHVYWHCDREIYFPLNQVPLMIIRLKNKHVLMFL